MKAVPRHRRYGAHLVPVQHKDASPTQQVDKRSQAAQSLQCGSVYVRFSNRLSGDCTPKAVAGGGERDAKEPSKVREMFPVLFWEW